MNIVIRLLTKLVLLSLLLVAPSATAAEAGKALFVFGDVKLVSAKGKRVSLQKNGVLAEGDTVITGNKARAQLLMSDNTKIALRPNSEFVIDAFRYQASSPAADANLVAAANTADNAAEFNLLKGGFRSITGQSAKTNPESFKVKTPVAVIGIRGTDFLGRLCGDADCGPDAPAGLYLGVNGGAIYAAVNGEEFDVFDDRFGFTNGTGFSHRASLPPGILDSGLGVAPSTSNKASNRFVSIASDPVALSLPVSQQTPASRGGNVEEPAGHEDGGTN